MLGHYFWYWQWHFVICTDWS